MITSVSPSKYHYGYFQTMNTNSCSIHNLVAIIIFVFVFIYIASEVLINDRNTIPCIKVLHLQPPIVSFDK